MLSSVRPSTKLAGAADLSMGRISAMATSQMVEPGGPRENAKFSRQYLAYPRNDPRFTAMLERRLAILQPPQIPPSRLLQSILSDQTQPSPNGHSCHPASTNSSVAIRSSARLLRQGAGWRAGEAQRSRASLPVRACAL